MTQTPSVLRRIEEAFIIPVIRAPSESLAQRAAEAILQGGIGVVEITMTVPGALDVIAGLRARLGDKVLLGAGTVCSARDAERCIDAGAAFLVSPGWDAETLHFAQARGVVHVPGVLTPTEVMQASKGGAQIVKVFPCSAVGGAKYLKALRGPFPEMRFMATGGINLQTLDEYVKAGASAVGIGGELVDLTLLSAGNDAAITARAAELVAALAKSRG
ncbi:MAG TPA: bifunctional 4-hydroxy-2-oxoglutarate aldolase/2-dehydro-3-deoxy-phosphogluconate aldolase [Polyangiaceae bacterium]|nr:bifunctional 4-hydroxy-2-oxoglutarate aldolase/2-dehydro-3-deoxy-phosphogluconate aldolase [Polyangiaceae bacterium]